MHTRAPARRRAPAGSAVRCGWGRARSGRGRTAARGWVKRVGSEGRQRGIFRKRVGQARVWVRRGTTGHGGDGDGNKKEESDEGQAAAGATSCGHGTSGGHGRGYFLLSSARASSCCCRSVSLVYFARRSCFCGGKGSPGGGKGWTSGGVRAGAGPAARLPSARGTGWAYPLQPGRQHKPHPAPAPPPAPSSPAPAARSLPGPAAARTPQTAAPPRPRRRRRPAAARRARRRRLTRRRRRRRPSAPPHAPPRAPPTPSASARGFEGGWGIEGGPREPAPSPPKAAAAPLNPVDPGRAGRRRAVRDPPLPRRPTCALMTRSASGSTRSSSPSSSSRNP
jgi:hypothetical protein